MTEGYILLKVDNINGYFGIDREIFSPIIVEDEIKSDDINYSQNRISSFYSKGWRRSAYELYEQDELPVTTSDLSVLRSYTVAEKIKEIIEPYLGKHEIFFIQISRDKDAFFLRHNSVGFDFAYLGGDLYSAIKNGMFVNRNNHLYDKYCNDLNVLGLFKDPSIFEFYIQDFKHATPSEVNSTFWIYNFIKPQT